MRAVFAACARTATFIGRRARMPRCHFVARSERERALHITVLAPSAKSLRKRMPPPQSLLAKLAPPIRLIPFSRLLPALECSCGVSPHQAAKSRAERNCLPSPAAATMACAVRPPMPGIVQSRRIASLSLAIVRICSSNAAIFFFSLSACSTSSRNAVARNVGIRASFAAQRRKPGKAAPALRRDDAEFRK